MLYVVSTPIGNLRDITLRALDTLKEADVIFCEDSRVTHFLLSKYEIQKELITLNAFNEEKKIPYFIERLQQCNSACLVTDAGTPSISDPGIRLISAAIAQGIEIVPVPGVSAPITALTVAGLPTDAFSFEGFIPQKKGRKTFLESLKEVDKTTVFFESSHRIEKLIRELNDVIPDRAIAVCRELTKSFEEVWRGTPQTILADMPQKIIKGEFVVVIAPCWWKQK
jgi:16S rRNA (cytidine1402-2'-O)-methyltransferase